MRHFSDEEPNLRQFLRQYRPVPPPPADDLETQLMEKLEKRPVSLRKVWVIPTAIAAGLLLTWTGYETFKTSPQYDTQAQALENFLVDSWDGTLEMEITTTQW